MRMHRPRQIFNARRQLHRHARLGNDVATRAHLTDYEVASVRNVEIAVAVKRHSRWAGKLGAGGRGQRSVPGVSRNAVANYRVNNAGAGIELANPIVDGVRDVDVAGGIEYHVRWAEEERVCGRSSVTGIIA